MRRSCWLSRSRSYLCFSSGITHRSGSAACLGCLFMFPPRTSLGSSPGKQSKYFPAAALSELSITMQYEHTAALFHFSPNVFLLMTSQTLNPCSISPQIREGSPARPPITHPRHTTRTRSASSEAAPPPFSAANVERESRRAAAPRQGDAFSIRDADPSHFCFLLDGASYRGTVNTTRSGRPCQRW